MVWAFSPDATVRSVSSVKSGPAMGAKTVSSAWASASAAAASEYSFSYSEIRSY